MAGVLETVNQRTQLVGQNRLELLLFRLDSKQVYGINVFKVREVLQCPRLTSVPKKSHLVKGLAHIRGGTIPVIDMTRAIGMYPTGDQDTSNKFIIITEYNRRTQGFLVRGVERIVNMNWEDIHAPPKGVGNDNYLTAVTEIEGSLVEIIDVEKILAELCPDLFGELGCSLTNLANQGQDDLEEEDNRSILVVDDSVVARKQIKNCLQPLGYEVITKTNGLEALQYLKGIVDDGKNICEEFGLMVSDVEMPEMDGYTLTAACKEDVRLKSLPIMLHTSLSGVFNNAMVDKVGADDFMAKFSPDELADRVAKAIKANRPNATAG